MQKIRRIRQKMHKHEVGKGRPTENRASNAIYGQEADKWVAKIDAASSTFGADVPFKIKAVSDVLEELANRVAGGEIEPEVMTSVLRRRDVAASLNLMIARRVRKGEKQ